MFTDSSTPSLRVSSRFVKKPSTGLSSDETKKISSSTSVRYTDASNTAGPTAHRPPVSYVVAVTGSSGGSSPRAKGSGQAASGSAQASSRIAGARKLVPTDA